jgi:gamma-glutamyltranspeptidase / glutathione hydrolase
VLVTGSPGGSRIITTVLQVVINVLDFGMPIGQAVAAPRIHHQWLPDFVFVESGLPPETLRALEGRGHALRSSPASGSAHSIAITGDGLVGAADARSRGALAAGY